MSEYTSKENSDFFDSQQPYADHDPRSPFHYVSDGQSAKPTADITVLRTLYPEIEGAAQPFETAVEFARPAEEAREKFTAALKHLPLASGNHFGHGVVANIVRDTAHTASTRGEYIRHVGRLALGNELIGAAFHTMKNVYLAGNEPPNAAQAKAGARTALENALISQAEMSESEAQVLVKGVASRLEHMNYSNLNAVLGEDLGHGR